MDRMPYTANNFEKDVFDALRWVVYTNDDFHRKAPLEIIISHGNIRRFRPASSSKHKKGEKKRQAPLRK